MKIAIVGSRDFKNAELLQNTLQGFSFTHIVSGGAVGADLLAKQFAEANKIPLLEFKPDYNSFGRVAPLVRNSQIVKAADFILAFWNGSSKGTLDTINKAKKQRKPYKIIRF